MKKLNKKKISIDVYDIKAQILISIAVALLSLYTYSIFIILWEIFLISIYLKLPKSINNLIGARILFSTIVLFSLFQAQSLIFWTLHIIINFNTYIYGSLIVVFLVVFILKKFFSINNNRYQKLSKDSLVREFLILFTPLILVGILLGGVFFLDEKDDVKYLSAISRSQDDGTHAGFFASLLRSNGNINSDDRLGELMPIQSTYPLGPHLSFAIFSSSITKSTHMKVIDEFKFYFFSKIILMFGTIYIISLLLFSLYQKLKIQILNIVDIMIYFFAIFITTFIVIMPGYLDGFFSFIPAMATIVLALILLLEKDDSDSYIGFSFIFSIVAISAALSWFLPVAIITSAYAIQSITKKRNIKNKKLWIGLIIYAVLVGAITYLQALGIFSDGIMRQLGLDLVLVPGGMLEPPTNLILLLMLVFFLIYTRKNFREVLNKFLYLIYPTLIILSFIIIYLLIKQYSITYAYYLSKTLYLLLILLIPICLIFLIKYLVDNKSIKYPILKLVVFYFIFLICSHFFFARVANAVLYFYTPAVDKNISGIVIDSSLNRFYEPSNYRVIDAVKKDSRHWNTISNNFARQSYRSKDCDYFIFDATTVFTRSVEDSSAFNKLVKYLELCSDKIPSTILYTDKNHYEKFKNSIPDKLLQDDKIILKIVN